MLNKILTTPSVAGKTEKMINLVKKELKGLFTKSKVDELGSVYFTRKFGEGKKLMLCCAIDTSGLVAAYKEGTKINVSSIGGFHVGNMAFSRVVFDKASGVLVPLGAYDFNTPITEFAVETGDEKAVEEITLGDTGYFDVPAEVLPDGKVLGFGAANKMCIFALCHMAKKLLENDGELLKKEGVGEIAVGFISHESLGHRGASCVSYAVNPDEIINIAPIDMTEKNVGSLDFDDGFAVKMLDKGFVADENTARMAENLLDALGVKHKRRISNNSHSEINRLGLCEKGAKAVEICLPHKFFGTRGECVKNPFFS